jgi:hypothetical protein
MSIIVVGAHLVFALGECNVCKARARASGGHFAALQSARREPGLPQIARRKAASRHPIRSMAIKKSPPSPRGERGLMDEGLG